MTLVCGNQKLGNVFQRICVTITYHVTHFLQFVTGQSLIAWMEISGIIVQTKTKAVKAIKSMVGKILFSVTIVKPAYQKVNLFDVL